MYEYFIRLIVPANINLATLSPRDSACALSAFLFSHSFSFLLLSFLFALVTVFFSGFTYIRTRYIHDGYVSGVV